MSESGATIGGKVRAERPSQRPDLVMALDAIYGYATDPGNWEEMNSLLDDLGAGPDDESFGTVMEGVRVHLNRAEELARRLHETPAAEASPTYCHMIVGRDQRIADIAPAAAALLAPVCGPLQAGARLAFADPENAARFRDLAASIAQGAVGPVLLRLVLENGEEAVFGYLVAESNLPDLLRRRLDLPEAALRGAVAFVAPDRGAVDDASRMYRETFGLTPAEARLAAMLKDGFSLKEASARLNISVNTARNQIKSVFDKLGVNRQSDLVRHLTELSQLAAYIRVAEGETREAAEPLGPGEVPISFVALPDGRRLAWREYGRADGIPIVLFASSVSSSYLWYVEAEAAARLGIRLVVVERPGTGASTPDPDLTLESFARDFEFFAGALSLDRFLLLARSSGSPFALTVAARLGARVERVMLTAPRLGVPEGSGVKPLGMLGAFFNNLRRYPWLLDSTLYILRAKMSRPFMRPLVLKFFEQSPVDVALIRSEPQLQEAMIRSVMETVRHTYAGLLRESQLYLDGITLDLAGMTAPVIVWHGDQDGVVPLDEMRRRLVEVGLVPSELRIMEGEGHCFLNRHHAEIFERLLAV